MKLPEKMFCDVKTKCIKFTHTGNLFSTYNMNLRTPHSKVGVNYYTQHSILVHDSQPIHHRWIILAGNIYFDKFSHSNRVKVIIKVKVKFSDDLIASRRRFYDKIDFNLSVLSYLNTDLYVFICHLNRQFMHSFSGYITKKVWYSKMWNFSLNLHILGIFCYFSAKIKVYFFLKKNHDTVIQKLL